MFYPLVLSLIVVSVVFTSQGQPLVVTGKVLNGETQEPISYANIGIINTPVGTISNHDGTFQISIPDKYLNEQLLVAALGFERKSFPLRSISTDVPLQIMLAEHTTVLKNVTITSKKTRPTFVGELGNQYFNEGSIYADSAAAGSAMALLIENKYPTLHPQLKVPYHIVSTRLRISHNTFENFKVRIRFLSADSITGLPDKDLYNGNIIASSKMKKGWLKLDLQKYNIQISEPRFFLVAEWLLEDEDRLLLLGQYNEFRKQSPKNVTVDTVEIDGQKITFNSWHGFRAGTSFGSSSNKFSLENYKSYYRNNSYGKWRRSSFILTARVTVANYE